MKKKIVNLCLLSILAASVSLTACQKEVLETPEEAAAKAANEKATLIFIRAVDKDSTVTTSEQILLR